MNGRLHGQVFNLHFCCPFGSTSLLLWTPTPSYTCSACSGHLLELDSLLYTLALIVKAADMFDWESYKVKQEFLLEEQLNHRSDHLVTVLVLALKSLGGKDLQKSVMLLKLSKLF